MESQDTESVDEGPIPTDRLVKPALGAGPGVLVIHSGRGLTGFVENFCKRLAREGYVAMAVDLFDGKTPETIDEAQKVKGQVDADKIQRVLQDSVSMLLSQDAVSRRQIGVIGLGFGAEWACWLASDMPSEVAALVLFYGYRDVGWERVDAPVLGHFAELDHELPPSKVDDLRERVWAADVPTDFFVYRGTDPSFFEDEDTANYDARAAMLAWERTTRFLDRTLRSPE